MVGVVYNEELRQRRRSGGLETRADGSAGDHDAHPGGAGAGRAPAPGLALRARRHTPALRQRTLRRPRKGRLSKLYVSLVFHMCCALCPHLRV
ncbi:hypothetical protein HF086_011419 [Spodoptera exigua]|uniref:Uncharacterized protein n=1 Tax=Spodoptera exigua TaxID=7107 RepID=A0A922MSG9_SPOEX|nr:hypothetical protein HF086_011419 [Spodoptera exigua]